MNNLDLMRKRLKYYGGIAQDHRMIKDKYKTFLRTLKYSYQACNVQLVQHWEQCLDENLDALDPDFLIEQQHRALINPDKTKQDYDDKILSIDYNTQYGPGDVFKWIHFDRQVVEGKEVPALETYWIIYLQSLGEDAYFRGEIRQCKHKLKFKDKEGNWCSTWAAIRGPVETQINSIQKNQIRLDVPNLSLNILMPRNEKTLQAFDRYKEFLFAGKCWRVEAPDSISMKNIIEVNAEEDYINNDTDDVLNEMKNGLIIEPIESNTESDIIGESFIKPKTTVEYISPEQGGIWCIKEKEVPVKIMPATNRSIKLIWEKVVSGKFTLQWHKDDKLAIKTIVVESLF